ncbi:predicted protein [Plenodomus lingam JN3]|uniref:Predicted protein n=1 Tax=Leptosphaeria maculans (strain JN3 / isolate v23.1.3 / race Av1-4-5-6-7-8) TaxID=985895 RepID=E4ZMF1_LEPMJ|nr:predicted protein [Plenodomus lingam JN3]CBX92500.1 predicted protein [Plenodomus lingam JN3]
MKSRAKGTEQGPGEKPPWLFSHRFFNPYFLITSGFVVVFSHKRMYLLEDGTADDRVWACVR